MSALIRITRGPWNGMTGRVINITADHLRVRLTASARLVKVPRQDDWYEDMDDTPMTAAEARERVSA